MEAIHPDTAKSHWPVGQKRRGVVILEEDGGNGNECAWCPVIESDREGHEEVAYTHWVRGEQLFGEGNREMAMECYARGAVADSSNTLCWVGIARVSPSFVAKN